MIPIRITANLELDPWTDLPDADVVNVGANAIVERIGVLPNGTQQGRATVGMVVRLEDGRVVLAETTLRLFLSAAQIIAATPVAQMEDM